MVKDQVSGPVGTSCQVLYRLLVKMGEMGVALLEVQSTLERYNIWYCTIAACVLLVCSGLRSGVAGRFTSVWVPRWVGRQSIRSNYGNEPNYGLQ